MRIAAHIVCVFGYCGSTMEPMNSRVPVSLSRIAQKKGRSTVMLNVSGMNRDSHHNRLSPPRLRSLPR